MAIEAKRGCGYRQIGGIYLVADPGDFASCCLLPQPLDVCLACGHGIKPTRGFQWVTPELVGAISIPAGCLSCGFAVVMRHASRFGLLWVGTSFYSTPWAFLHEAVNLGVSRRVTSIPKDFTVGEDHIALAHREVYGPQGPGLFMMFRPTRAEIIVRESDFDDPDKQASWAARGLTPIPVPDADRDHRGKVDDAA